MTPRDSQEERIIKIIGDTENADFAKTKKTYHEYLKANLSLPCEVTGIEDFGWEEFYIIGPGNRHEYNQLKKNSPSYTDRYELMEIVPVANFEWALFYEEDLGAHVHRISDGKEFVLGLAELKVTDTNSKNYELLDDYSYWLVNCR